MSLIQIAGGLVLVVLVVAFLFRGRFAGGARLRSKSRSRSDIRPTLPPSPYQPSRGFRMLGTNEPEVSPRVELPRLDPQREFVFSDPLAAPGESLSPPHLRHDEQWALDRSLRHSPHPRIRRRRLTLALVVIVVAVVVALLVWHSGAAHHSGLNFVGSVVRVSGS